MFLKSAKEMKFGILEAELSEFGFQTVLEYDKSLASFVAEGIVESIVDVIAGFFKMLSNAVTAIINFILRLLGVKQKKSPEDDIAAAKKAASNSRSSSSNTERDAFYKKYTSAENAYKSYTKSHSEQKAKDPDELDYEFYTQPIGSASIKMLYRFAKDGFVDEQLLKKIERIRDLIYKKGGGATYYRVFGDHYDDFPHFSSFADYEEHVKQRDDKRWNDSKAKYDNEYKSSQSSSSQKKNSYYNNVIVDNILNNPGSLSILDIYNAAIGNDVAVDKAKEMKNKFENASIGLSLDKSQSDALIRGLEKVKDVAETSQTHSAFIMNAEAAYKRYLQPIINEKQTFVNTKQLNPGSIRLQDIYDYAAKDEKAAKDELTAISKKYSQLVTAIGESMRDRATKSGIDEKDANAEFSSIKTSLMVGYSVLKDSVRAVAGVIKFSQEVRQTCADIVAKLQLKFAKKESADDEFLSELDPDEGYLSEFDPDLCETTFF